MAVLDAEVQCLLCYRIIPAFAVIGGLYYFRECIYNHTYKRSFAWIMNRMTAGINKGFRKKKTKLFENMFTYKSRMNQDLDVLEIGAGSAANLEYYPPNTKLICLEPNLHFNKYMKANLDKTSNVISAELVQGYAEDIGMDDGKFDVVVCTLVLCSVTDPEKSLKEIKRVLKPGGMFLFLEHVADKEGTLLRKVQFCLNRIWMVIGDGCHVDRDTEKIIRRAGFNSVESEHFRLRKWCIPAVVKPHVFGVATK